MVKTVETGKNVCTVVLNGEECAVSFADDYLYYSISNFSDDTVYASFDSNVTADADGVVSIPSGAAKQLAVCVNAPIQPMQAVKSVNSIFIVGNGKVMVEAGRRPFFNASFKMAGKGGESINVSGEGNPVALDGLQGGVPFSEIAVSGKNCIDTKTYITNANVTDNGDNIFVEWTAAMYVRFTAVLSPNTDYILSWEQKADNGTDAVRANVINVETNEVIKQQNSADVTSSTDYVKNYFAFNTGNCSNVIIQFIRATDTGNVYIKKTVQLELGDTATAYEPPITGRELTVGVSGKNLLKYPYNCTSGTYNGINLIIYDDGTFDISGTATVGFMPLVFFSSANPLRLIDGKKYTISCNYQYNSQTFNLNGKLFHSDGTSESIVSFPTKIIAKKGDYITFVLWVNKDVAISATNVQIQIELGDTATDYEPYHGASYTITPDSNPYTIPNDIRQQDGVNVVSVSAGELSVTGIRKNAAIKSIWDNMGMDLLFDGLAIGSSPAVGIDFSGYSKFVVSNYLNTSSNNCDFAGTVLIERDRLELLISSGWFLDVPISTSYSIRDYFSGTISDASFYAMQSMDASAQYFTRIYGIR